MCVSAAHRAHAPDARARPQDAYSLLLARCAGFNESESEGKFCWQVKCHGCEPVHYGCDLSTKRTNHKKQEVLRVWDCGGREAWVWTGNIHKLRAADKNDQRHGRRMVTNALSKAEERKKKRAHPYSSEKKVKLDASDSSDRRPPLSELNGIKITELEGKTVIELEDLSEKINQQLALTRSAETRQVERLQVETLLAGDLSELDVDALEQLRARAQAVDIDAERAQDLTAALEAARDKREVERLLACDAELARLDVAALEELVARAAAVGVCAARAQDLKAALEMKASASLRSAHRDVLNILRAARNYADTANRQRVYDDVACKYPSEAARPRAIQVGLNALASSFPKRAEGKARRGIGPALAAIST